MLNNIYVSPSTKTFSHSIDDYLSEILLIKKYPEAINKQNCWKDPTYLNDFIVFQQVAHILSEKYPIHFVIETVIHSEIQDFTPNGLIVYINRKLNDWISKNNTYLKNWTNNKIQSDKFIKDSDITIQSTKRKTFNKRRFE